MLRRAIRLHLPAPIGHDNGGAGSSSDEEDFPVSPSVAYTTLRDDKSVRDRFRKQREDVSGVNLVIAKDAVKKRMQNVAELSMDEQRRAADAWARLQTLYGLFQELEATADEASDESDGDGIEVGQQEPLPPKKTRQRLRRDDGLRSLLQHVQLPCGVVMRDLKTLAMTDGSDKEAMPQGFTADMFEALGDAMYKDMLVAAKQNRISSKVFAEIGNLLYADAASVVVSATA